MLFQTHIGIEFTTTEALLVATRDSFKGFRVVQKESFPLDIETPVSEQVDPLRHQIRSFFDKNDFLASSIHIAVPQSLIMTRTVEFPALVKDSLPSTVKYEIGKYFPFDIQQIYYGFLILSEDASSKKIRVLLAAVRKTDMAPYLAIMNFRQGGISSIELGSQAIFRALSGVVDQGSWAMVSCADKNSGITVIQNNAISDQVFVPGGIDVSDDNILSLLEKYGSGGVGENTPVLGASNAYGIPEGIDNKIDYSGSVGGLEEIDDPRYITGCGLSLKGVLKKPGTFNFLPGHERRIQSRFGYFLTLAMLVLVLISIVSLAGSWYLKRTMTLNELNRHAEALSAKVTEIKKIQTESGETEKKIEFLNQWKNSDIKVIDILKELSLIIPETAWIKDIKYDTEKGAVINGFADSASDLIVSIESSALFSDAKFMSAITKNNEGKDRFRIGFQIE